MGIPIRLDTTFILVPLALYTMMPDRLYELVWPATLLATLGVFLSILCHELGHAVAAKRQQVGVAEIIIGGFYGYAALKRQAVLRKQQIRILLAGPFANLAIFLLLWLAYAAAEAAGALPGAVYYPVPPQTEWFVEGLRVLAMVNLGMFLFNIVPAFPLDGGKVLGLLLDRRLAPRRSLQIVSLLGITMGVLIVFLGVGLGLFLVFVGIFIVVTNLRRLRRRRGTGQAV